MHFRKLISIWALIALMIAQLAVAQHSAAHFDHGFETLHLEQHAADDNHDTGDQNPHYECPEYLLTKSMQHALLGDVAYSYVPSVSHHAFYIHDDEIIAARKTSPYQSRAPPAFLI